MQKLMDPILTSLYHSPLQPSYWQLTLDQICKVFHARSAVLSAFSMSHLPAKNCNWSTRDSLSLEKKEQYDTYMLSSQNPRARVSSQNIPALTSSNACISIRDKDLFKEDKQGLQQIKLILDRLELGPFLGTGMSMGDGHFISLALHRAQDHNKEFSAKEEQAIHQLMPHLRQSIKLSHRLNQQTQKITTLESILNQSRLGVIIYSPDKQYYPMNNTAKRMLDGRYGLRIKEGQLIGEKCLNTEQLHQQISLASAKDTIVNKKHQHFIKLGSHKKQNLKVQIQVIDPPTLANQLIYEGVSHQPSVILLLSDDASFITPEPEKLIQLFALSPAEAKLVSALCRGVSLNNYAQHRGIAVTTARYQLKQAFNKTNTSSQVELLLLVISSVSECL